MWRPEPKAGSRSPPHQRSSEKSALDASTLLDAPAGKYGFVTVKEGRLNFSKGRRARFFGVTLLPPTAFPPDNERAVALADRLARSGVNLVRLGDLDVPLGPSRSLFDDTRDDTKELDAESLSKLDMLIAAFKERGIYVAIELQGGRKFRDGDDTIPSARQLPPGGGPAAAFDPAVREAARKAAEALLSHVNPLTGLSLRDDPVLAWVTLAGELSLFNLVEPERFSATEAAAIRDLMRKDGIPTARRGWQVDRGETSGGHWPISSARPGSRSRSPAAHTGDATRIIPQPRPPPDSTSSTTAFTTIRQVGPARIAGRSSGAEPVGSSPNPRRSTEPTDRTSSVSGPCRPSAPGPRPMKGPISSSSPRRLRARTGTLWSVGGFSCSPRSGVPTPPAREEARTSSGWPRSSMESRKPSPSCPTPRRSSSALRTPRPTSPEPGRRLARSPKVPAAGTPARVVWSSTPHTPGPSRAGSASRVRASRGSRSMSPRAHSAWWLFPHWGRSRSRPARDFSSR